MRKKVKQPFRYFFNPECTKPMVKLEFPFRTMSEEEAELLIYAKNISHTYLDMLEFTCVNPDVTIVSSNDKAYPMDVIQLRLKLKPKGSSEGSFQAELTVKGRMREANE